MHFSIASGHCWKSIRRRSRRQGQKGERTCLYPAKKNKPHSCRWGAQEQAKEQPELCATCSHASPPHEAVPNTLCTCWPLLSRLTISAGLGFRAVRRAWHTSPLWPHLPGSRAASSCGYGSPGALPERWSPWEKPFCRVALDPEQQAWEKHCAGCAPEP